MASFNKVILMGNLTRDVETRNAGGTTVANVTLAVTEKYKTKSGEQREDTAFVDCTLWGRTAEVAAEYLRKGSSVLFEGKLKQDSWEDKSTGQKRSKLGMTVQSMQMLGGGSKGGVSRGNSGGNSNRNDSHRDEHEDSGSANEEVPF